MKTTLFALCFVALSACNNNPSTPPSSTTPPPEMKPVEMPPASPFGSVDLSDICKKIPCDKFGDACIPKGAWNTIGSMYIDSTCTKMGAWVHKELSCYPGTTDYAFSSDAHDKSCGPAKGVVYGLGKEVPGGVAWYKDATNNEVCTGLLIDLSTSALYEMDLTRYSRTEKIGCE